MTDAAGLRGIADALVDAGVVDVIVCPGSRSTPLALATRADPGLRVRVLLDERAAGFFALGLARATRRPVAIVVTSGTAVANLLPVRGRGVAGSRPARPAHRGPATRAARPRGAADHRAGAHLRRPRPLVRRGAAAGRGGGDEPARPLGGRAGRGDGPWADRPARSTSTSRSANRSSRMGCSRPPPRRERAAGLRAFTDVVGARARLSAPDLADLAARIGSVERGLIVAGPQDDPDLATAVARLAAVTGFPIAADPLSGVRCGPHDRTLMLSHVDHLVRPGPWREAHAPDLVLRVGRDPHLQAAQHAAGGDGTDPDRDRWRPAWSEPALIPTTLHPGRCDRHGPRACGPARGGAVSTGRVARALGDRVARGATESPIARCSTGSRP